MMEQHVARVREAREEADGGKETKHE